MGAKAIVVPSWQRARDLSCAALFAGEMCHVVTGLPGTGKSLLVQTVAHVLRSTGWKVAIFKATLPSEADFAELTDSAAILIDDADGLTAAELRTLNRMRSCSVLLAGAVGFEKRCPADSRVTLTPLPPEEIPIYVDLWLEDAKHGADRVDPTAIERLADVSGGVPSLLSALLSASLKIAASEGAPRISAAHVDSAAWRYVEQTAARRTATLHSDDRTSPGAASPNRARPGPEWEERFSQAPFVDTNVGLDPPTSTRSQAPRIIFLGAVLLLASAAGLLIYRQLYPTAMPSPNGSSRTEGQPLPAEPPRLPDTTSTMVASTGASEPALPIVAMNPGPPATIVPQEQSRAMPTEPLPDPNPIVADESQHEGSALALDLSAPHDLAPATMVSPGAAREVLSPAVVKRLNQRGDEMADRSDVSAARLLFEKAAEAGSVYAMLAMGRTFDPALLGLNPLADRDMAAHWYRRAAASGSSDALIFIQQLERSP